MGTSHLVSAAAFGTNSQPLKTSPRQLGILRPCVRSCVSPTAPRGRVMSSWSVLHLQIHQLGMWAIGLVQFDPELGAAATRREAEPARDPFDLRLMTELRLEPVARALYSAVDTRPCARA